MPLIVRSQLAAAVLGALDAIYLLILKYSHNEGLCLGSGGCATVNASRFSEVMGVPVAAIGLFGFAAIAAVLLLEARLPLLREYGDVLVFGMSLTGVLFSAYLTYLELYVIHAVCPFCVISAVLITTIFVLAVIRLVQKS